MAENIVRKEEIACYKQFLLFSQCCPQLYILGASKCGILWVKPQPKQPHVQTMPTEKKDLCKEEEIFSFSHNNSFLLFPENKFNIQTNIYFVNCNPLNF